MLGSLHVGSLHVTSLHVTVDAKVVRSSHSAGLTGNMQDRSCVSAQ